MKSTVLFLGVVFLIAKAGWAAAPSATPTAELVEVLQYDPSVSILSGRLEIRSFSNDVNGERERQFVVVLSRPIAVAKGADFDQPATDPVTVVTVVPYGAFDLMKKAVGSNVVVKGKLFAAVTAHHHTPVLLGEAQLIQTSRAAEPLPTRPLSSIGPPKSVSVPKSVIPPPVDDIGAAGRQDGAGAPAREGQPSSPVPEVLETRDPIQVRTVEAVYPYAVRRAGIQGDVVLEGTVTTKGDLESIRVLRGVNALLDTSAMRAVQQYSFKPALRDGNPVAAKVTITVTFRLQ